MAIQSPGLVYFRQRPRKRLEFRPHIGHAACRPDLRRDPRPVEIVRDLLTHQRGLLRDLLCEVRILGRRLVDDDAERRLQSVSEVPDMGPRALHHADIRFDQSVELLLERQDFVGRRAFELGLLARPDRRYPLADVLERAQPEPDLEECRKQKAHAQKSERQHDGVCEIARFVLHSRRIEGHGNRKNPALIFLAEIDVPLQHAKELAFGTLDVALAHLPCIGPDADFARRLVGFAGKRVRLKTGSLPWSAGRICQYAPDRGLKKSGSPISSGRRMSRVPCGVVLATMFSRY